MYEGGDKKQTMSEVEMENCIVFSIIFMPYPGENVYRFSLLH